MTPKLPTVAAAAVLVAAVTGCLRHCGTPRAQGASKPATRATNRADHDAHLAIPASGKLRRVESAADVITGARELAESDPDHAAAWVQAAVRRLEHSGAFADAVRLPEILPDPVQRDAMVVAIARDWASVDPAAAGAWGRTLPPGPSATEVIARIVETWSRTDAPQAADFAATLPNGDARRNAFTLAIQYWAAADVRAASAWLAQATPGPDLDAAAYAIAVEPRAIEKQPSIAAAWAESIADPYLRLQGLSTVLRGWMASDPVAAEAFLARTAALGPDARAALASQLFGGG